jgi:hypothetical protein
MLLILSFFVVAMGLSIYCWTKKQGLIGLLSFVIWFLFVVYSFGVSVARWDIYYDFALIGVLLALIMIFTSIYMIIDKGRIPGEEEEKPEEDYVTRVNERRKKLSEAIRRRRGED